MRTDRASFAVGVWALALAGMALWHNYGQIDWRLAGVLIPLVLVVIGAGVLLLSRHHN